MSIKTELNILVQARTPREAERCLKRVQKRIVKRPPTVDRIIIEVVLPPDRE